MTLVDTNVLLYIVTDDPTCAEWSIGQLDAAALKGKLAINDVAYAELSVRVATIEALIEMAQIPRPALFLAGKIFQRYRSAGGKRTGVLPDFFIGAHVAVAGLTLLIRDARRYRSYFPTIDLVRP
jgi:predicted nucleic acid-binding protein